VPSLIAMGSGRFSGPCGRRRQPAFDLRAQQPADGSRTPAVFAARPMLR